MPRHLAPSPAYPHPYPYLIRGFPDTAALENRQTLLNDYITSQQMHQWPAAAAMAAQRSDLLRGLAPREQPLPLSYSTAPRGTFLRPFVFDAHLPLLFIKMQSSSLRKEDQAHSAVTERIPPPFFFLDPVQTSNIQEGAWFS